MNLNQTYIFTECSDVFGCKSGRTVHFGYYLLYARILINRAKFYHLSSE